MIPIQKTEHLNKVCEKGTFCQYNIHQRGTFFGKMVYKGVRGWTSGPRGYSPINLTGVLVVPLRGLN